VVCGWRSVFAGEKDKEQATRGQRTWSARDSDKKMAMSTAKSIFPAPWRVETIPNGLKVVDATGLSLAYVYFREQPNDAQIAKVLTEEEAQSIASNIEKLPTLLGKGS